MSTLALYVVAALAEIAGCFAFWHWLRSGGHMAWLLPGVLSLVLFAWLLTRSDVAFAGRAYAAYGGIYIVSSVFWLWAIEGRVPDRWDFTGAVLCVCGATVILFAPRSV